jgi:DNA-3-methyladenine glycosylase II
MNKRGGKAALSHAAHFSITPPYDFAVSLRFSKRSHLENVDDVHDKKLRRVFLICNVPVLAEIECFGNIESPHGIVRWTALNAGDVKPSDIIEAVRRIICADLDLLPFYLKASRDRHLLTLTEKFRGLKPLLTSTIFEAAAWAIMGQQVNLHFAYTLKKRLVENFGRRFSHAGREWFLFPRPADLAELELAELRSLQFSARKAEYLRDLSHYLFEDSSLFDSLVEQTYLSAVHYLMSIRGIGIWSANYILLRGAGFLDCLPLGDSGLHRAVRTIYRMRYIPDNKKIEKLARPMMPYRSLFTLYLWFSLMKGEN